jgi:hypothetical protein
MKHLLFVLIAIGSALSQTQDSSVNPVSNTISISQYDCRAYMSVRRDWRNLWLTRKRSITPEKQVACVADPATFIQSYPLSHNLRTNGGVDIASACLFGTSGTCGPIQFMALGTGTATPAVTDTSLGTELTTNGLQRQTISSWTHTSGTPKTCAGPTFTYTGSSTVTVTEIGMFNASSSGTLVYHSLLYAAPTVTTNGNTIIPSYCFNF